MMQIQLLADCGSRSLLKGFFRKFFCVFFWSSFRSRKLLLLSVARIRVFRGDVDRVDDLAVAIQLHPIDRDFLLKCRRVGFTKCLVKHVIAGLFRVNREFQPLASDLDVRGRCHQRVAELRGAQRFPRPTVHVEGPDVGVDKLGCIWGIVRVAILSLLVGLACLAIRGASHKRRTDTNGDGFCISRLQQIPMQLTLVTSGVVDKPKGGVLDIKRQSRVNVHKARSQAGADHQGKANTDRNGRQNA